MTRRAPTKTALRHAIDIAAPMGLAVEIEGAVIRIVAPPAKTPLPSAGQAGGVSCDELFGAKSG
jgi:hypothetical protein